MPSNYYGTNVNEIGIAPMNWKNGLFIQYSKATERVCERAREEEIVS